MHRVQLHPGEVLESGDALVLLTGKLRAIVLDEADALLLDREL